MNTYCPAGTHLVRVTTKLGKRDMMNRPDVDCSACGRTVKAEFIQGTKQRPTPTGYYLRPHWIGGGE